MTPYEQMRDALKLCGAQMCMFCQQKELARSMLKKRSLEVYCHPEECEAFRVFKAALALPRRNCDEGTTDEQERRFEKFCDSHKWVDDEGTNACLSDCPLYKTVDCAIHWAQMPYEVERKGEGK